MSHLLDVNLLLACGWDSHSKHLAANRWLGSLTSFATCPTTQMGFIRVSMSPGYSATFENAQSVLQAITKLRSHRFLPDETMAISLPNVLNHRDISDGHLVRLAMTAGLRLATLDETLCQRTWAKGLAENPV